MRDNGNSCSPATERRDAGWPPAVSLAPPNRAIWNQYAVRLGPVYPGRLERAAAESDMCLSR
jgi:hypothetical protein